MSVLRGRPPDLAGGISGSKKRNWSSVSAWPEPKPPTSARSAGVHMAVSGQETACNAARGARISPSNQPRHPFANGHLIGLPGAGQPNHALTRNVRGSERRGLRHPSDAAPFENRWVVAGFDDGAITLNAGAL